MATLTVRWAIDARRTAEIPIACRGRDFPLQASCRHEGCGEKRWARDHFSEVLIFPKLVDSLVPTPCTALMIASAMPAAINPYSIAVAPLSSAMNSRNIFFMTLPLVTRQRLDLS